MLKDLRIAALIFRTFGFRMKYLFIMVLRLSIFCFTGITLLLDRVFFPGCRRHALLRPVFLIGHPRSGTTFLHRFIVNNCGELRSLQLWEMMFPALTARKLARPFLGRLKRISLGHFYDPRIHRTGFAEAETEDIALFLRFFDGLLSWMYFHAYRDYPSDAELDKKLAETCEQDRFLTYLKEIHQRNCYGTSQRMLSKSFAFIFNLEQIRKVFPEVRILILLRDPAESVPSLMSLERSVQNRLNNLQSQHEQIQRRYYQNLYRTSLAYYKRAHAAISSGSAAGELMAISYSDLRHRFGPTFHRIAQFCGIDETPELMAAVAEQEACQVEFKSRHEYSLDEFGLSEQQLEKDFSPIYEDCSVRP